MRCPPAGYRWIKSHVWMRSSTCCGEIEKTSAQPISMRRMSPRSKMGNNTPNNATARLKREPTGRTDKPAHQRRHDGGKPLARPGLWPHQRDTTALLEAGTFHRNATPMSD